MNINHHSNLEKHKIRLLYLSNFLFFSHDSSTALGTYNICWSVGLPLWTRLMYLNNCRIAMKVTTGIHGAQRMKPKDFGHLLRSSLTFPLFTMRLKFVVSSKIFDSY